MTTNIFLQARVNSTRFPKKTLKEICGKTIIELILERMKLVNHINKIILVTGPAHLNDELIIIAKKLNMDYFCGNEENVLDRFYKASLAYPSDNLIRITCDNPLVDFSIINECLKIFSDGKYDILHLDNHSLFPEGLNFEIFSHMALTDTWELHSRRFVNIEEFEKTFISPGSSLLNNSRLRKFAYKNKKDFSNLRLTIDYEEDFALIQKIYEEIYPQNQTFTLINIIDLLSQKPELIKINEKYNIHMKDINS